MRRKTVPWLTSAFLFFTFVSGSAFDAHAQPGPSANRRDRFASLLLSGDDPVAERARQREGDRRRSAPVPAPSLFADSFAGTKSAPRGGSSTGSGSTAPRGGLPLIATSSSTTTGSPAGMPALAIAALRRRPAPSRSIKYLKQRAVRLERKSQQIVRRAEHLRSMHPANPRVAARIEQILGVLARQERSTLRQLSHVDRQLASPTTAVAAIDPLGLRSVVMARHPGRLGPLHHEVARSLR